MVPTKAYGSVFSDSCGTKREGLGSGLPCSIMALGPYNHITYLAGMSFMSIASTGYRILSTPTSLDGPAQPQPGPRPMAQEHYCSSAWCTHSKSEPHCRQVSTQPHPLLLLTWLDDPTWPGTWSLPLPLPAVCGPVVRPVTITTLALLTLCRCCGTVHCQGGFAALLEQRSACFNPQLITLYGASRLWLLHDIRHPPHVYIYQVLRNRFCFPTVPSHLVIAKNILNTCSTLTAGWMCIPFAMGCST